MTERIITNNGRVNIASPCHVYQADAITRAQATALGARCRIVSLRPHGLGGYEVDAQDGGCDLAVYTKTNQDRDGLNPAWYSRDRRGLLRDTGWGVLAMQPDSGWAAYHLDALAELEHYGVTWTVDAFFTDSAGPFAYSQGGRPARPPGFTVPYTQAEFLALIGVNLEAWIGATGKRFLINGLTSDTMSIYPRTVGMIENAFRSDQVTGPTEAVWIATASLIWEAQRIGWTPWPFVKIHSGASPVQRDRMRRLGAYSALLLDHGSLLYEYGGDETAPPPWITGEYERPEYNHPIGLPVGTSGHVTDLRQRSGLWVRHFAHADVVVNPTGGGVRYNGHLIPARDAAVV